MEKKTAVENSVFNILNPINVNDHVEKKPTGKTTLSYLSWPWAWAEVVKRYPDANYEIVKNENNLPYFADPQAGIMVYTRVTIDGVTREMWLPVMDGANNAMKLEAYELQTRYGAKPVAAATMFDINKTVMRCLVKNLAMFGLGLYIYAGEDLPEESESARLSREAEAAALRELMMLVDGETKTLTAKMDTDAKKKFASEVIIPIIGVANYKTCNDVAKLSELKARLDALIQAA